MIIIYLQISPRDFFRLNGRFDGRHSSAIREASAECISSLTGGLRFAEADTRAELRAAFGALAAVVAPFCADVEAMTETFWVALHGLAELERSSRIRSGACRERVALVVGAVADNGEKSRICERETYIGRSLPPARDPPPSRRMTELCKR